MSPPYARECWVRDCYASELKLHRPDELLIAREHSYAGTAVRADMRTIDRNNIIRVWEFKIRASYKALGQILVYVAMARRTEGYTSLIRGVIAAFEFKPEIVDTAERMNLNIELVTLPPLLATAGEIPGDSTIVTIPSIPATRSTYTD